MKRSIPLIAATAACLLAAPSGANAQGAEQPAPWTQFGTSLFATGSDVWVKFYGSDAGFTSYLFSVCDLASSCSQFLFQNHDAGEVNEEVQLDQSFTPGEEVIFKLAVNSPSGNAGNWFTGPASRNADDYAHFATQTIDDVTSHATYTVLGGFEDESGGGDGDRNDLMFEFGGVDTVPVAAAPEPASLVLVASGLAGLAGLARRRARRR